MQRFHGLIARILAAEFPVIACAVAVSAVSPRLLPLAAGIACVFVVLRLLQSRTAARAVVTQAATGVPRLPFVLLGVMLIVSCAVTAWPELTWPQALRVALGIALFFALIHWVKEEDSSVRCKRLAWIHAGLLLLGVALALAAPFVVEWQGAKFGFIPTMLYARFPMLTSDSVNPNVMAGALVILIPLPLARLVFTVMAKPATVARRASVDRWVGALALVSLCVTLVMLVLTQSRSAYLAFAAAATAVCALRWRAARRVALIVGVLTLVYFAVNSAQLVTLVTLLLGGKSGELDSRIEIWTRAWYMIQDFMFTGIGMGSFEKVTDLLYPLIITPPGIPHAHNLFLQVAVDLGVPGLIAWLGILGYAVLSAWRAYRYGEGWVRALGAGLLASNVAMCVHGLTDAVTWGIVRTAPLVWLLWGVAVAAGQAALDMRYKRLMSTTSQQPSSTSGLTPSRS